MTARECLALSLLRHLIASEGGRKHLLLQIAQAESGGETALFDRLLERVTDPKLRQIIERHRDDELRHEKLFRALAARYDVEVRDPPREVQIIPRLEAVLGSFSELPSDTRQAIYRSYSVLRVIEERATVQFELLEAAFRPIDPQAADVFAEVRRDEERHLRYCDAVLRQYGPNSGDLAHELDTLRIIEARAFAENQSATLTYLESSGLVAFDWRQRLLRTALPLLAEALGALPLTSYFKGPRLGHRAPIAPRSAAA